MWMQLHGVDATAMLDFQVLEVSAAHLLALASSCSLSLHDASQGHVALVTELMRALGEAKPALKPTVIAVFIANEENATVSALQHQSSPPTKPSNRHVLYMMLHKPARSCRPYTVLSTKRMYVLAADGHWRG